MRAKQLSLIVFLTLNLVSAIEMARADGIDRIDLRVEGMT